MPVSESLTSPVESPDPAFPPLDRLRRIAAFLDIICLEEEESAVDGDVAAAAAGDVLVLLLLPCFKTIILRVRARHSFDGIKLL